MNCQYCGNIAKFKPSRKIYNCKNCRAHVSLNSKGKPLGSLAKKELRSWRIITHRYFDRLYTETYFVENKVRADLRTNCYNSLALKLDIPRNLCHIGYFGIGLCINAIHLLVGNLTYNRINRGVKKFREQNNIISSLDPIMKSKLEALQDLYINMYKVKKYRNISTERIVCFFVDEYNYVPVSYDDLHKKSIDHIITNNKVINCNSIYPIKYK